jgi:hypothetical protein
MAVDVEVICVKRKPEYFCEKGWTCDSVICPVEQPFEAHRHAAEDVFESQRPHHNIRMIELDVCS